MGQRALIIEDEIQAISALTAELTLHCPDLDILGNARSVQEGIKKIQELQPDIVFLDIQLADGLGFEILEQFNNHTFKVIFTTAFSQYAIKAIKFSALDYLLKPIDAEELKIAVKRVGELSKENELSKLQTLISNFQQNNPRKRKIALQTAEGIIVYELENIIRCTAERNYTEVFLSNGKKAIFSKTLKDFEDLLSNSEFERVHHSHIINLNHLVSFIYKDGGYAKMSDNSEVPVSQRKKSHLINTLNKINKDN